MVQNSLHCWGWVCMQVQHSEKLRVKMSWAPSRPLTPFLDTCMCTCLGKHTCAFIFASIPLADQSMRTMCVSECSMCARLSVYGLPRACADHACQPPPQLSHPSFVSTYISGYSPSSFSTHVFTQRFVNTCFHTCWVDGSGKVGGGCRAMACCALDVHLAWILNGVSFSCDVMCGCLRACCLRWALLLQAFAEASWVLS
jgi:hypothetical protein